MTTLKFVGDVPLWLGVILSIAVAAMSWRYYRRESLELSGRLRWLLPTLRTVAFVLGILILTGPVLHHRQTIGDLGKVQIYFDGSESMQMLDPHMSLRRKLEIVIATGWLPNVDLDQSTFQFSDALQNIRTKHEQQLLGIEQTDLAKVREQIQSFGKGLADLGPMIPPKFVATFESSLTQPLARLGSIESVEESVTQYRTLFAVSRDLESAAEQAALERLIQQNDSVRAALTQFDETPRWQRAQAGFLQSPTKVLTELRKNHEVNIHRLLGQDAIREESLQGSDTDTEEEAPVQLFASATDLATGISTNQEDSVASSDPSEASQAKTSIVLVSDGQHNSGPSPIQAARILGAQGIPFFCVSMGAAHPAYDLSVVKVAHPERVFRTDLVRGTVTIRDQYPAGHPVLAQIFSGDTVLWRKQLRTENSGERRIDFEFSVDPIVKNASEGSPTDVQQHVVPLALRASLVPLADELQVDNNHRRFHLAAIADSQKVLILDGRSRWETRYLRNAFERDEQWSVNTVIAGAATENGTLPRGEAPNQFPATRSDLFEYDLVIFGEIGPELFEQHELIWLQEFVDARGGGMIFIDGQRGLLKQLAATPLAGLLPVRWLPDSARQKPKRFELTDSGEAAPALRLSDDSVENRRLWSELPPPHSFMPVESVPSAQVLVNLDVADKLYPVIIRQPYGAGQVLFMAFDESWRWRYRTADLWHQRLWNQFAELVMPPPYAASDEYVSIDSGKVRYESNDSVPLRVRLNGLDGAPMTNANVDALIWKDNQLTTTVNLKPDPDVPGVYRAISHALSPGAYEVSVQASGFSQSALQARSEFVVMDQISAEQNTTSANERLLQQLATESGGLFLREEEIGQLPDRLLPFSQGRVIESDHLIWQSYWWFFAILSMITIEWILRKRVGLL
ncbi:hypothetical protein FF011L_28920 [Roseimaritima multifibrata]|uniref:Uncharacterized protein n=1 Tax=Roseimaritima multifibrata TaxID=1930274 RepID=A0A517MGV5_9BACT|nr:VWA domain-containing protein [Roseimaritima multifibrata]QDS94114.1 hypothetical protein FF011L_28920 [Roseimaritima multifibrata]